ncbi:hypothetical protein GmHk_15G044419 [Glycine max]|nr:hypothetical protein GmHk_15G044419 [Glycine max]KAH1210040.1 hypothetical protein GmHk_15G044419 [Glycine max]
MAKIQGPKEEKKPILIFTKKNGPNLGPWAQKSTLRFMRTLGPSLVALAQSSWILLSNTLGGLMATPPGSPPPPPAVASQSLSTLKWTCKATRLRSLATRPPGAERPMVHIDPATGKADGPHKKKLRTYLEIVACGKVDMTYETWKEVPTIQKDLIWEDIQAEFDIPEASDGRTKKKILQTVRERWRQFKSDLTRKWALAADNGSVDDIVCEKYDISKEKWAQFCQTRRDPSWEAIQKQNTTPHVLSRGGYEYLEQKLMAKKTKKNLEEAAQSGGTEAVIDPPSPIRRHMKWKMAHTKKTRQMMSEATKEIVEKIDSLEKQASQGSFVPHGRQDLLTAAIGRPEHPGRVRAAGAEILWIGSMNLPQFFLHGSRRTRAADLTNQGPARGVDQIKSDLAADSHLQSQIQSQGLALPPKPEVGPSAARVSTKGSCVDPSTTNLDTGDSDKCGLYIEKNPSRLVALGRVYEGSTIVHNIPLLNGQVKVFVEEVKHAYAPVPVPTSEVAMYPAKPANGSDPQVHDPLYLMTLTIPQLFLKPLQVTWDATVFEVFDEDFPLYIKHEDLSEIAHDGQCLNIFVISVIQLWILHLIETSMRAGNSNVYGFLEPELDNYVKGIINSALKGLDDTPQPKSKVGARWIVVKCNRQKGSTECGYYVIYWMSTIILGSFRNNWETYFNDVRPLEAERLKALRIQWAQHYLKVRNQT